MTTSINVNTLPPLSSVTGKENVMVIDTTDTLRLVTIDKMMTDFSTTAKAVSITNANVATSTSTGALVVGGGVGVGGNVWIAGNLYANGQQITVTTPYMKTDNFIASVGQTSFNLSGMPNGNYITFCRNGVTLSSNAGIASSNVVIYDQTQNNNLPLKAGDRIEITYINGNSVNNYITSKGLSTVSGSVGRGVAVNMDNFYFQVSAIGSFGLQMSTVSGSSTIDYSTMVIISSLSTPQTNSVSAHTIGTSFVTLNAISLSAAGDIIQVWMQDIGTKNSYRITLIAGASFTGNIITIERIYPL
jgi:hypothetical protein